MNDQSWLYQFLRRGQKYTGTDNVYLAKGGLWLILGQVIALATSFLLAVIFANLLTPAIYGEYKYAISLFAILEIFSLVGLDTAVGQAVARNLEGSFYTALKIKLKWALLGSAVALGMAVYYWLRGNSFLALPLIMAAIFLPLMNASGIYASFLAGRKLFNTQTKYNIANQVIFTAAMIATIFLTKNPLWLIATYLVSRTFLNYFFYLLTKIKFRPNRDEDSKTINYGKHVSLMGVISQGAAYLDNILLFAFMGPAQLAVYSFARMIPEQIQGIMGNINTLAFPKLATKSREEIRLSAMKKFWKVVLLTGAITVLYIIIAPFFFKIFFPQYLSSIRYSQAFMLSGISIPVSFLGTVFQAKMMKKELYLIKIGPFIRIGLLAVLIPFYGIWGAIIAIVGAEIFKSGLVLFLFRKF